MKDKLGTSYINAKQCTTPYPQTSVNWFYRQELRRRCCQISWVWVQTGFAALESSLQGKVTKSQAKSSPPPTAQTTLCLPRCCSTLSCPPESKAAREGAQRGLPATSSGSLNRWSLFWWPRGSRASSLCQRARRLRQKKELNTCLSRAQRETSHRPRRPVRPGVGL